MTAPSPIEQRADIEDNLVAAARLNDLIDWVTQARQFIENMRHFSKDDRVLQLMKERGYAAGPEWSEEHEGLGLFYAHRAVDERLGNIATLAGIKGDAP